MKKLDLVKLAEVLTKENSFYITHDGDKTDLRLHLDNSFYWGAKKETAYKKACKEIDNIKNKGNGWFLYCWYDVSGFDYWMKKEQEQNYVQISIGFDSFKVSQKEIASISEAIENAVMDAKNIIDKYDYNPCN